MFPCALHGNNPFIMGPTGNSFQGSNLLIAMLLILLIATLVIIKLIIRYFSRLNEILRIKKHFSRTLAGPIVMPD